MKKRQFEKLANQYMKKDCADVKDTLSYSPHEIKSLVYEEYKQGLIDGYELARKELK
jgi:hypothetical protein